MSKYRALFVAVALAAGSLAGMASAATMVATYRGTVVDGIDQTNLFGAGNSLDGLAFKAILVYDPETPGARRSAGSPFERVQGGSGFILPSISPMRSAALTINGHTESFEPSGSGEITTERAAGFSGTDHFAQLVTDDHTTISKDIVADAGGFFLSPVIPRDLDSPVPLFQLAAAGLSGGVSFGFRECVGGACVGASGNGRTESVQVAPVPLPAALPLLASGLAGLGFVAFRRRRPGHSAA